MFFMGMESSIYSGGELILVYTQIITCKWLVKY